MRYQEICGEKLWFAQELPSPEEYRRAIANLTAVNFTVDYIVTHTAPKSLIPRIICGYLEADDLELTGFLDWVYHDVQFSKWFFGHFHVDMPFYNRFVSCYRAINKL